MLLKSLLASTGTEPLPRNFDGFWAYATAVADYYEEPLFSSIIASLISWIVYQIIAR